MGMARFPTIEEFAKETAEKALDDFEYQGKTIREWAIQIVNGDIVPVVRCKNCKKWNEETGFCDEHSQFYEHGMYWDIFAEEDFCSYGERRTNETD